MLTRSIGVAAVLLCVAGLTYWSAGRFRGPRENTFGGIACHEVRANLEALAMGKLPDDLAERIHTHLRQCPDCQVFMQQMKMNQRQTSTASGQAAHRFCPNCRSKLAAAPKIAAASSVSPKSTNDYLALAQSP